MNSPEKPLQLPLWTRQDPVLQQLIDAEASGYTVQSGSYSPESARSFMMDTPRTPHIQTAVEILTTNSRTDETSTRNETIPAKREKGAENRTTIQEQPLTHSQRALQRPATRRQHSAQRCSQVKRADRAALTKASGIKKRTSHTTACAPIPKPRHAMRTRSQGVTTFYALNSRSTRPRPR